SPHGGGAIALLERLVPGWRGKTLILVLLGFTATDFVFTRTVSAAAAAEHLIHNPEPHWQSALERLGEAGRKLGTDWGGPVCDWWQRIELGDWQSTVEPHRPPTIGSLALASLGLFPRLALGLSGFELTMIVMPLIRGRPDDDPRCPRGRIRATRRLLVAAAL